MSGMKLEVDATQMLRLLDKMELSKSDMLDIAGSGARIIINGQRERIPRDTAASANSVNSHIEEASSSRVVDNIGPEMHYDPYLEFGTGIYAENGQGRKGGWKYKDAKGFWHFTMGMKSRPFVRPSVFDQLASIRNAITAGFAKVLKGFL